MAYDFNSLYMDEFEQIHKEKCDCGREIEVLAEKENEYNEYHTTIYIKCDCGKGVKFYLPVN